MHLWTLLKIFAALVALGLTLTGCFAEDYAKEEGLVPQPGNEFGAELLLQRFTGAIADGDYGEACEMLTPALRASASISSGSCRAASEKVRDEGGLGTVKVISSDETPRGLWVKTSGGLSFLIRGKHIAGIRE
jgi:hypothetical protein